MSFRSLSRSTSTIDFALPLSRDSRFSRDVETVLKDKALFEQKDPLQSDRLRIQEIDHALTKIRNSPPDITSDRFKELLLSINQK
jgi:hypothetical protein